MVQVQLGGTNITSQKSLYGTDASYTIHPTVNQIAGGAEPAISGSVYSPAAIYFRNFPRITVDTIVANMPMNIVWNADVKNENGVFVYADYQPVRPFNRAASSTGYQTEIKAAVHVPDNGSTTLPASFFSKFPSVGVIELTIGRGNAQIVSSGTYQYQILFESNASVLLTH